MPGIDNRMQGTVMEGKNRPRRHLSEQAWAEVFRRFDGSGESMTGFCKREGVHTSSFQRWRRRLGEIAAAPMAAQTQVPRETPPPGPVANFIEMGSIGAASEASGRLEIRLELGGGLVLQLVRG